MRKTNLIIALAVIAGLTVASCSDDDLEEETISATPEEEEQLDNTEEDEEVVEIPDTLSISPYYSAVFFSASGETLYSAADSTEISTTFTVETSAEEWSAEVSSTWCTITVDAASNTFTLQAAPNTSDADEPEPAVVTVSAGTCTPIEITVSQQTFPLDIYVVGYVYYSDYESAGGSSRPRTAGYWKNGERTDLVEKGYDSYVRDIKVIDGDVYVSGGYTDADESWHDGYWKNGEFTAIEYTKDPQVYEMQISDAGDVYLCGYDKMRSAYWKNGAKTTILNKAGTYAYGMWLDGANLHFVGVHSAVGRHWTMTEGSEDVTIDTLTFTANSVCMSGSDIYIAGYKKVTDEETGATSNTACYSVNGSVTDLAGQGSVNKIRILDGKIVCTGTGEYYADYGNDEIADAYTYAQYWVDGAATQLTSNSGAAYGVTSFNGNIFVAGAEYDSTLMLYRAVYWRNGVRYALDDTIEGQARDIVVIAAE